MIDNLHIAVNDSCHFKVACELSLLTGTADRNMRAVVTDRFSWRKLAISRYWHVQLTTTCQLSLLTCAADGNMRVAVTDRCSWRKHASCRHWEVQLAVICELLLIAIATPGMSKKMSFLKVLRNSYWLAIDIDQCIILRLPVMGTCEKKLLACGVASCVYLWDILHKIATKSCCLSVIFYCKKVFLIRRALT